MNNIVRGDDRYIYLAIENNVLRAEDTVVQLSSISRTKVGKYIKYAFPVSSAICIMCALVFLTMGVWLKLFYIVALVLFVYAIYSLIKELKIDVHYLILELNSGSKMLFECCNKGFLEAAQEKLVECMKNNSNCSINFSSCTINKIDRSQFGNGNYMDNGGK